MVLGAPIGSMIEPGISRDEVRRLFVELRERGFGGVKVPYDPDDWSSWATLAPYIREVSEEFAFLLSAHGPGGDISSTDDGIRGTSVETIRKALAELGKAYPGIVVAVHPEDYLPARTPGDDQARMDACHESLVVLAATAATSGARIALENMRSRVDNPNRTGMYTHQLMDIVADLDPSVVGICFDTGHGNISEKGAVTEAFERCASRVIHVHLDDNLGVDDQHLPPGDGNIDFAAFFRTAKKTGYDGMIELELKVPENEPPMGFYGRNAEYCFRNCLIGPQGL